MARTLASWVKSILKVHFTEPQLFGSVSKSMQLFKEVQLNNEVISDIPRVNLVEFEIQELQ